MQLHKLTLSYITHKLPYSFLKLTWTHEVPWACMQFHELLCSSILCLSSSQEFRSACSHINKCVLNDSIWPDVCLICLQILATFVFGVKTFHPLFHLSSLCSYAGSPKMWIGRSILPLSCSLARQSKWPNCYCDCGLSTSHGKLQRLYHHTRSAFMQIHELSCSYICLHAAT